MLPAKAMIAVDIINITRGATSGTYWKKNRLSVAYAFGVASHFFSLDYRSEMTA